MHLFPILTDVTVQVVIYEAFDDGRFEAPIQSRFALPSKVRGQKHFMESHTIVIFPTSRFGDPAVPLPRSDLVRRKPRRLDVSGHPRVIISRPKSGATGILRPGLCDYPNRMGPYPIG